MGIYSFLCLLLFVFEVRGSPTRRDLELERPTRIVGGEDAKPGAYPYQVSIQKKSGGGFYPFCGGALVEPDVVVTAAHCVRNGGTFFVAAGMNNLRKSKKNRIKVSKYKAANYRDDNKENDIALLKLERRMRISRDSDTPIDVIAVPPQGFQARGMCTITGWGRTAHGGSTPTRLQRADVKIIEHQSCVDNFPKQYPIGKNMLCAGGGPRDACQGDSGGPMACVGDDNKLYLSGITSWGIGCATPKVPGVYTEVAKYSSWIEATIKSFKGGKTAENSGEEEAESEDGDNEGEKENNEEEQTESGGDDDDDEEEDNGDDEEEAGDDDDDGDEAEGNGDDGGDKTASEKDDNGEAKAQIENSDGVAK